MADNPFEKKSAGSKRASLGLLDALGGSRGDEPLSVQVADLVANPNNPAARSVPDEQLVASIGMVGILVPLLVQSAETFLTTHPHLAEAVSDAQWVVLAGHKRLAAAKVNGLTEVPAIGRADLDSDDVMFIENTFRQGLSPLDEARLFARSMDRQGLSQRKLAEHLSIPQSQVSRRLQLLDLPPALHDVVDNGALHLEHVPDILKALDGSAAATERFVTAVTERIPLGSTSYVGEALRAAREVARTEREARVAALAKAQGTKFVADPLSKFPDLHARRLTTKKEIAAAEAVGELAMIPDPKGGDGVEHAFISTAKKSGRSSGLSEREATERAEQRDRLAAAKARRLFLGTIMGKKSVADSSLNDLRLLATLRGYSLNSEVSKQAQKIASAVNVGPIVEDSWMWGSIVGDLPLDDLVTRQLGAIITVASIEVAAAYNHSVWGHMHVVYLTWLTGQGYSPTDWERSSLAAAEHRISQGDATASPTEESQ